MPFFNLYYAVGLFDTVWAVALAHCLFNVPLAVWILEGFIGGVPREIDETAAIDGYSFPRFFVRIFLPLIANGVGVTAFFCFMFSWVEQLLATTLTATYGAAVRGCDDAQLFGLGHGLVAAGRRRRADDDPRRGRHLVRAQPHRPGLRPGPGLRRRRGDGVAGSFGEALSTKLAWMAWTWPTAIFFVFVACALIILTLLAIYRPERPRKGVLGFPTTRGDRFFVSMLVRGVLCKFCGSRFGGGALWYPLRRLRFCWLWRFFASPEKSSDPRVGRGHMGRKTWTLNDVTY